MKIIKRDNYLEELRSVRGIPDVKVITGLRRSGKSKLMESFIDEIKSEAGVNIVHINMNLRESAGLREGAKLYNHICGQYRPGAENLLFIDEIQMCAGFEEVINALHDEELFDIYITGSNAFLLSSDLATLFRGRTYEISVFPFSFSEYLVYHDRSDIDQAFDDYVMAGGLAGSYLYKNRNQATKYVQGVFRTTVIRDIVDKYHIENENLLIMLADFLMDNVGNKTSIRNITNCLGLKTNDKTIGAYLTYLNRVFLFYPLQRFDIKGKKYLQTDKKYYLADTALRFAELGTKYPDWGHLYENIVALELLRRGYEVYVGVLYNKEIDFVAIKNGERVYIQVCDDLRSDETFNREIAPLLSIKDAFSKVVIARTKHDETQIDGVRIIDIARWLANSFRKSTNFS